MNLILCMCLLLAHSWFLTDGIRSTAVLEEKLQDELSADQENDDLGTSLIDPINEDDDDLGTSLIHVDSMNKYDDDLGTSLIDCMNKEDNDLGTSLVDSMNDEDDLGTSLIDLESIDSVNGEDSIIYLQSIDSVNERDLMNTASPLITSTPTKMKDVAPTQDVEFVHAKTRTFPKEKHLLSEFSPGDNTKLFLKYLTPSSIHSVLKRPPCACGKNCFKSLTYKSLKFLRYKYWTRSRQLRSQWLIQTVKNSESKGKFSYFTTENGHKLCSIAFLKAYGINKNLLVKCRSLAQRNRVATDVKKTRELSVSSVECIGWLENYFSACGDRMPDKDLIYLPYRTTKLYVYNIYKQDTLSPVSKATFGVIWKQHFPHVKFKKTNTFSMCNSCAILGRRLESNFSPLERAESLAERRQHNHRQMMERKCYYMKREESRKNPSSYMSLIIDGMDQSKSSLPHITGRRAKVINPADLLKTHITGVINHGFNEFTTFLDYGQYPHDPNLVLNVLLRTLLRTASKQNNKLPPVLYLQADNCWRENKNRFVIGFCELLVRENIFHEVFLSFLLVGHTHEDVDARFSKIAEKLRTNDAETIPQLASLLPSVTELHHMLDIKSWIKPYLWDMEKHTEQHHFKFTRVDGSPRTFYKNLQDHEWLVVEESVITETPKGKPGTIKPDLSSVNIDRLERQVNVMKFLFRDTNTVKWWSEFIKTLKKDAPEKRTIIKFLESLPRQIPQTNTNRASLESTLPEEIQHMLQKETRIVNIKLKRRPTGNKRKITQKKSGVKTRKHQQSGSQRQKYVVIVLERRILILKSDEEKRHIWYMILCVILLLETYKLLLLFDIIINCLQVYDGLDILLKLMQYMWLQVLWIHMGMNSVQANVIPVIPVLCLQGH